MAYAQNTITSANAANDFATVLTGLLITAGWTLVEALTPAGTFSPNTKVYKSAGASNLCGYDWYVAVMYKGTGTEAQVQIIGGGAYDAGTHTISQIPAGMTPPTGSSSRQYAEPVTGDMFGGYVVNVATNTTTTVVSAHAGGLTQNKPWFAVLIPSSAFAYWMSVTRDHVAVYTTVPGAYVVGTLDTDADWLALNSSGFGNGVATNPIISYVQNATVNTTQFKGISATAIGVTGTPTASNQLTPRASNTKTVGVILPSLTGGYFPAYAWKDAFYLESLSDGNASSGGTPAWTSTGVGLGLHIGDVIDFYRVYGGSIGDTVTISGSTYVLSGLMVGANTPDAGTGIYVAVLVEP